MKTYIHSYLFIHLVLIFVLFRATSCRSIYYCTYSYFLNICIILLQIPGARLQSLQSSFHGYRLQPTFYLKLTTIQINNILSQLLIQINPLAYELNDIIDISETLPPEIRKLTTKQTSHLQGTKNAID